MIEEQTEKIRVLTNEILNNDFYSNEIRIIVEEATEMLRGRYIFNNIWDMEPCLEFVENPLFRWNLRHRDDPEWTFMFTRFDFSYKFIVAYEVTGQRQYIDCGLRFIDEWEKSNTWFLSKNIGKLINKVDHGNNLAHRTLDVAILACNVSDYVEYCFNNKLIDKSQLKKYRSVIKAIGLYLLNSDREFKTITNWGPIETGYSLYTAEKLEVNLPKEVFLARLQLQLKQQIYEDGSHVESSPMYLVEVLMPLLKCIRFLKKTDISMISEVAKKCCEYLLATATPDCCIPNIGDSDKINLSDIMIMAYYLYNDDRFLAAVNRQLSLEFIYKYKLPPLNMNFIERTLIRSGSESLEHQVLITDKDDEIYLLCSNIPHGPSGHKHYDYLSFILYVKGKEILIDCGRETYKDGEIRRESKSPQAHNTIAVNGTSYWKAIDAWRFEGKVEKNHTSMKREDDTTTVFMTCELGDNEIKMTRVISYVKNIGIFITDFIKGNEFREYEAYFNFEPDTVLEINGNEALINKDGVLIHFYTTALKLQDSIGRCSVQYNNGVNNKRIICYSKKNINTHYFLFDDILISQKYDDGMLSYYEEKMGNVELRISCKDEIL